MHPKTFHIWRDPDVEKNRKICGLVTCRYNYLACRTTFPLFQNHFKRAIIFGLLSHVVVTGPPNTEVRPQRTHTLQQTDPGTFDRNPGSRRRFAASCRNCPNLDASGNRNTSRQISYYCVECYVHLHPECFDDYHANIRSSQRQVRSCPPGTRGPQHDPASRRRNLRNNIETQL